MGDRVFVVFNPQSGRGRGGRLVEPVLEVLRRGGPVEHAVSERAGDEGRLAEQAIARGFERIVAVGGDGTWSNVGNAILRSGSDAALGLIAAGTGCDLAKSLGIPASDLPAATRVIREGVTRRIDVGRIEDRYFLNIAGFGYDIAVIEDSWHVHWLKGNLVYLYCALKQIVSFPGFPVEVGVDGTAPVRQELLMLIVANARIFGGGFKIAPTADLGDGRLDLVAFRNMGTFRRLGILIGLLRGTHQASARVSTSTAGTFRLGFDAPPRYETDGEWNQAQAAQLEVTTLPQALRVLVPTPA